MLAIAANAVTKNSTSASLKGDGEMKDGPKGDSHAKKEAAPCKDECQGKEWCKDDCMECWEENGACPTKCDRCYPRCAFCLHDARMAMEEAMEEKKGTKGGAGGAQTAFVKTSGVDAQARLDRVAANMQRRH